MFNALPPYLPGLHGWCYFIIFVGPISLKETQSWSSEMTHPRSHSWLVVQTGARCKLKGRLDSSDRALLMAPLSGLGLLWTQTQVPHGHSGSQDPLAFGRSPGSHQVSALPLGLWGRTLLHSDPPSLQTSSGSGFTSEAIEFCMSIVLPAGVLSTSPRDLPSCHTAGMVGIPSGAGAHPFKPNQSLLPVHQGS